MDPMILPKIYKNTHTEGERNFLEQDNFTFSNFVCAHLVQEMILFSIIDFGEDDNDSYSSMEIKCEVLWSELIDVHVVGEPSAGEFALGSNLTVECTLNASSSCASLYHLNENTRLVLMRQEQVVAEGRASSPPRFNFVAHGLVMEFQRVDTFVCRALDEFGVPLLNGSIVNEAEFNYCCECFSTVLYR